MTNPNTVSLTSIMFMVMIINLLTNKPSIMCMNLILYTIMMSLIMSMKMKLTPIPYIIFLTMIGGLMIIFLYLAATMWMKKETMTHMTKITLCSPLILPIYLTLNSNSPQSNKINLFEYTMNKITLTLIFTLVILLVATIEIHMKMNNPFRRKLKIWD